jgi:predicted secreted protein
MRINKLAIGFILFTFLTPCWAVDAGTDVKAIDQKTTDQKMTLTSLSKPIVVPSISPAFTIRLSVNGNVDHQWFLADYNPRLVKLLGHQYIAPKTKTAGASGISAWDFQLQQIGFGAPQATTITLEYRNLKDSKAIKQQVFTILSGVDNEHLLEKK